MIKKLLFIFLAMGMLMAGRAQDTKEDIQKRQQELQKELDDLNSTLSQIKKNKKQSISQLAVVQRKIRLREEMVNTLNRDLKRLDNDITNSTQEISSLKSQLDTLKQNYAKSIVFAYKNRSNYDYLNFLFSATSFNDAIKRIAYLKSYRHNRELQADNIVKTEQLMEQKIAQLTSTKTDKNRVLGEQSKQLVVLEDDKKQKDIVLTQLKNQEEDVSAQIRNNEKNRVKLRNALQQVIRREQERLAEEAKRKEQQRLKDEAARKAANAQASAQNKAAAQPKQPAGDAASGVVTNNNPSNRSYSPFESTPEGLTQSINFESGRGNLPWPVSSGIVSIPFGPYQIQNIKGYNDGITIALPLGASVKAVADGEVSAIFDLGGENAVIIRHGKYFTTYSNLATVTVNKGDQVKAGKVVGTAAADESGEGQLQFDVTNDKSVFLDPEQWLKHR
ncbi:MAG TPA: peptidoglycan DD-metalloendopeptidase family protein [Chitinophagaceae bacterium]|nr:peptidoglycan DD-metalloendopeptidase family protein [Chitinophagaceae bacterium]